MSNAMIEKSEIYLEVARRARGYTHFELSADYYEAYAQEQEAYIRSTIPTFAQIAKAVSVVVRMRYMPESKIPMIKEVRLHTDLGLKDAKELVEAVLEGLQAVDCGADLCHT